MSVEHSATWRPGVSQQRISAQSWHFFVVCVHLTVLERVSNRLLVNRSTPCIGLNSFNSLGCCECSCVCVASLWVCFNLIYFSVVIWTILDCLGFVSHFPRANNLFAIHTSDIASWISFIVIIDQSSCWDGLVNRFSHSATSQSVLSCWR